LRLNFAAVEMMFWWAEHDIWNTDASRLGVY